MADSSNASAWEAARAAVAPFIRDANEEELPIDGTAEHTDGFNHALDLHQFPPGYRNT